MCDTRHPISTKSNRYSRLRKILFLHSGLGYEKILHVFILSIFRLHFLSFPLLFKKNINHSIRKKQQKEIPITRFLITPLGVLLTTGKDSL